MSMATLERAILAELKTVAKNPKLKTKDILEWRCGDIEPQEGETVLNLPGMGVHCAIKKEMNRA